jgi:drug/metabolite transporter (DMT)-like permease
LGRLTLPMGRLSDPFGAGRLTMISSERRAAPAHGPVGASRLGAPSHGPGIGALGLIAGLTLVWSCNWPFMKIALGEAPVWWFRAGCVSAGGIGLILISSLSGSLLLPRSHEVAKLVVCATFAIIGWHLFTAYGLINMPAGRASIIAYTMPLWAALFSALLISERLSGPTLAGLTFGTAGLVQLIGPDIVVVERAPVGAMFMLLAAVSWALGTVLFKRTEWSTPVAVTAGWMLMVGAVVTTVGAFALEPFPDLAGFRQETWIAIAYVFLLPMVFGQWAFYRIVHLFSPTIAAISTMLVPVIGVISNSLLTPEPVSPRDLIALALISAALFSVLVLPTLGRRLRK